MKKLLLVVAVAFAAVSFSSCTKECTCKENRSGVSQDIELKGGYDYKNCKDLQNALNDLAGQTQDWSCK
jgi:hypothetical protein